MCVPTVEEVSCRSSRRNVLDPLLGHIEMTMSRNIIVKRVSRTISGTLLSEPAEGIIIFAYRNWGTTTVEPQSSLVQSHGRLQLLGWFDDACIRRFSLGIRSPQYTVRGMASPQQCSPSRRRRR